MDPVTIGVGVGWGISILGWLISPSMTKLVNKGWSYLGDVSGSSADKLQDLESKVQRLKLMFEAAQGSPDAEEKSQRWLKKLKSAFYDADDILDKIDYHRLLGKALIRRQSANTTKQKATAKKDFSFPPGSKDDLRKTLKKIEKLLDEGEKLLPLLRLITSGDNSKSSPEQTKGSGSHSKTTSKPPKVFGRDEDAKNIIRMLHDTAADHFAILIHGLAGSGKTTLAQYVCESEKKKFDLFMWIQVTKNFSVDTVYKEMLEKVSGQAMGGFSNLDQLETELQERLKSKRLLLVLDDVWYSEILGKQDDVKKLLSPFMEAGIGSRVILTSRTTDAAKLLDVAHHLEPIADMNEEEFSKMFMHYALGNSMVTDQAPGSKFETVGKDIAALLQRSPLAARTVAGQLRGKPLSFWIDTSIQKEKRHLLKDTMGALWWSYHQLEEHVRQCFSYCSMFPRRYSFQRSELVRIWVAQGFVDTSTNSDMEFAAGECFEVLKSASFIQINPNILGLGTETEYYTVHDLLHDLAERVAGSDCFRIDKDMVDYQIPQDVRHIFIHSDNLEELIEKIVKLDTLRTIVMSRTKISAEKFKLILKDLKKLRFVQVWLGEFERNVIPECIGELRHLRYLGIFGHASDRGIIDLPPAFTKLYHLHELFIPGVLQVQCPGSNDMADLENLRHIRGTSLRVSIPNIGRMPRLQTLGSCYTVKKEKGYEITQLEKLDNIRGVLSIRGLENIKSKEDARRANLSNKTRVFRLQFDWKSYEDQGTESGEILEAAAGHHQQVGTPEPGEILEALHPPALLNELIIKNYGGSTIPSWLSGDGKLELLELSFYRCHGSGSQLRFSEPLPNIHSLRIIRCSWDSLPDNIEQLSSLENLNIYCCPNIQSPPRLPPSLKQLSVDDCPNISTLLELPPSLEGLRLQYCPNIQSSPPGLLSSVKTLWIRGCPNISTLPELPPSLKILSIHNCPNISTLPELPPSLEKLWIRGCPNISTLPELPPSLEQLDCEQYLVDSYPDRQAIDRINIITR